MFSVLKLFLLPLYWAEMQEWTPSRLSVPLTSLCKNVFNNFCATCHATNEAQWARFQCKIIHRTFFPLVNTFNRSVQHFTEHKIQYTLLQYKEVQYALPYLRGNFCGTSYTLLELQYTVERWQKRQSRYYHRGVQHTLLEKQWTVSTNLNI